MYAIDRRLRRSLAVLGCSLAVPLFAVAQQQPPPQPNPILVIQREFVKPGRDGLAHEKTETAYAQAFRNAHSTDYYLGMTSMTGEPRALFLSRYPSLEGWAAARKSSLPNAAAVAAMDKAGQDDGDLLSSLGTSAWQSRPDLSHNPHGMRAGTRYLDVTQWVIKPGHTAEFVEAVKLYTGAEATIDPDVHWAMYEMIYGATPGPTFLVITADRSLSEIDGSMALDENFRKAIGPDGARRLQELTAASVQTEMSNLFALSPKMSYPAPDVVAVEPAFWQPRPVTPALKKTSTVASTQ